MTNHLPSVVKSGRGLGLAITTALLTGGLAVYGAIALDLPLRDPDGFLGPSWTRLPAILFLFIAVDLVPRVIARSGGIFGMARAFKDVVAERWPLQRLLIVLIALASFYVTYVGYRNLKSFLPVARAQSEDLALKSSDQMLAFGVNPAVFLHDLLGTGVSAHVLSFVYTSFLFFVPISLAAALVWSKNVSLGLWYTTALCLNWALGTASYYLLPALGPFAVSRWTYADLPITGVSRLQEGMLYSRASVLADPHATQSVQSIAAFASLHTSIVFTAALIVHFAGFPRVVRATMWVFLALTLIATIYFGWHYLIDDIAGLVIGIVSVTVAAVATRGAAEHLPALQTPAEPNTELAGAR